MKNCVNCIYCDLLITEEPCESCLYSSNWELDEDKEEDKDEDLNK